MTVGLYHIDKPDKPRSHLPALMLASVRRAMPDVEIVQFTTDARMRLAEVDRIVIRPELPLATALLETRTSVSGDWLFLDTDVIVREDVRHVFDQPFDVAFATREGTLRPHEIGTKFMANNRFNSGVAFSRSQQFWRDALANLRTMSEGRQRWCGDQESLTKIVDSGRYQVRVLPNRYNYPPFTAAERLDDKSIVHFKGKRKAWMQDRAA